MPLHCEPIFLHLTFEWWDSPGFPFSHLVMCYVLISKYHLCAHDYIISLSNPNFFLKFQTCENCFLFDIVTCVGTTSSKYGNEICHILFLITCSPILHPLAVKPQPWIPPWLLISFTFNIQIQPSYQFYYLTVSKSLWSPIK